MDVDILEGIVVVHVHGHIEFHAAHGIHQLHKPLGLQNHIEVNGIAQQGRRLGPEGLRPIGGVHGVELAQGRAVGHVHGVNPGVAGEGQQADSLGTAVIGGGHDAVGEVGGGAGGGQQEGVYVLPTLRLAGLLGGCGKGGDGQTGPDPQPGGRRRRRPAQRRIHTVARAQRGAGRRGAGAAPPGRPPWRPKCVSASRGRDAGRAWSCGSR